MEGATRHDSDQLERPFRREGALRRLLPFAIASTLGLGLLLGLGPHRDPLLLAIAGGFVAAIVGLALVVPWSRLPRWMDLLPPLSFLVLLFGLRQRFEGLEALMLAPYFLLPLFWVALYGTRGDLLIMIAAACAVRFGPGLRDGFAFGEVGHASGALVILATVAIVAQGVVHRARAGERQRRAILDRLPVGFAITRGGIIRYANAELAASLDIERDRLLGRPIVTLVKTEDRDAFAARLRRGQNADEQDLHLVRPDGTEIIVQLTTVATTYESGTAMGLVLRDVSRERLLRDRERDVNEALAAERELFRMTLDNVDVGVAILDRGYRGVFANKHYLELFGLTWEQFAGMTRAEFISHASSRALASEDFVARFGAASDSIFEFRLPRPTRQQRVVRDITTSTGAGLLVIWRDVTGQGDPVTASESRVDGAGP